MGLGISIRERGIEYLAAVAGEKGRGFEVASEALGSKVRKELISVYDLSPERLGTFDVVVCGSLMLHLRDPVKALEAIRSVCGGHFMSVEQVSLRLTLAFPRRAVAEMRFTGERGQWWVVNARGHRMMVEGAGFDVISTTRPFSEHYGPGHPANSAPPSALNSSAQLVRFSRKLLAGNDGVPHAALLARPSVF